MNNTQNKLGPGVEDGLNLLLGYMNEITEKGFHPYAHSFKGSLFSGYVRDNFKSFSSRNSMFLKITSQYLSKVKGFDDKVGHVWLTLSQAIQNGGTYTNKYGAPVLPDENSGCPVFHPLSVNVPLEKLSIIQKYRLHVKGFEKLKPDDYKNALAKGDPEWINGLRYDSEFNKVSKIIPGQFRKYTVYNACEFDGLPANMTIVPSLPDEVISEYHQTLLELADDNGVDVRLLTGSKARAKYNYDEDYIAIRNPSEYDILVNEDGEMNATGQSKAEYVKSIAHELIHSTGFILRDNRFFNNMNSDVTSLEEVLAETGSVMLCSSLSVPELPIEDSANYIMGYLNKSESSANALWAVSSACGKIMSALQNNDKFLANLVRGDYGPEGAKPPVFLKAMVWFARSTTNNIVKAEEKLSKMMGVTGNKSSSVALLSQFAKHIAKHEEKTCQFNINGLAGNKEMDMYKRIKLSLVEAVEYGATAIPKMKEAMQLELSSCPIVIPPVPSKNVFKGPSA